ncbi:MAG: aminodeoxychorismate/anthranilate synthase component II [Ruminococcus sp.]|jgi:anthranilate synthase component 2|nr:aminodeoxychorismate/anthranilate synthase component II [Ruminococcus sp.]
MILLIDNYDSFTYNLYQALGAVNPDIMTVRNDKITLDEIEKLAPSHIVISPGPGRPKEAGIIEDVIKTFRGKIPILGVCLGLQAIVESYGGEIDYAKSIMHGKQSEIEIIADSTIFKGIDNHFKAARYHSLSARKDKLPANLEITAMSSDGEIMAIEDKKNRVYGLQFHPESVLTPTGEITIKNFLEVI